MKPATGQKWRTSFSWASPCLREWFILGPRESRAGTPVAGFLVTECVRSHPHYHSWIPDYLFESPHMTCISEAHLFDNPYFVLPGKVPACSKCGRAAKEECVPRPDVRAHLEGVAALMNGSDQTSKWMKELRTKKEVVGSVDPLWQRSPGVGIWGLR